MTIPEQDRKDKTWIMSPNLTGQESGFSQSVTLEKVIRTQLQVMRTQLDILQNIPQGPPETSKNDGIDSPDSLENVASQFNQTETDETTDDTTSNFSPLAVINKAINLSLRRPSSCLFLYSSSLFISSSVNG